MALYVLADDEVHMGCSHPAHRAEETSTTMGLHTVSHAGTWRVDKQQQ